MRVWIAWFGDRLVFQKQTEIFGKWMCSRPHLEERGNTYQSLEAALFMGADSQVASPAPVPEDWNKSIFRKNVVLLLEY
jgi:hypothetical protein